MRDVCVHAGKIDSTSCRTGADYSDLHAVDDLRDEGNELKWNDGAHQIQTMAPPESPLQLLGSEKKKARKTN
jgi:hypothetical protein